MCYLLNIISTKCFSLNWKTIKKGSGCCRTHLGPAQTLEQRSQPAQARSTSPSPDPNILLAQRAAWFVSCTTVWPLGGENQNWVLLNPRWTGHKLERPWKSHRAVTGPSPGVKRASKDLLEVAEATLVLTNVGGKQKRKGGNTGCNIVSRSELLPYPETNRTEVSHDTPKGSWAEQEP